MTDIDRQIAAPTLEPGSRVGVAATRTLAAAAGRVGESSYVRRSGGVVLVIVVAVFSWWVRRSLTPGASLDDSWVIGLSLGVARGLAFGRHIVFTLGPLGLTTVPMAVTPATLALGVAGAAAIWLSLVAVVLRALRRLFAWPVATLVAILGLNIVATQPFPPLDEIAFGLVAIALAQPSPRAREATRTLALVGGALAGLALLVKLNDGIGAAAIVAAGLLGGVNRRRYLAIGALTLVVTMLIAWLSLAQPFSALPHYIRTGRSIVEGYVDAMGYDQLGPGGEWEIVVVILAAIALSVAAWLSLAEAPLRRRVALAGCVLLVHYFVAREMLVRYWAPRAAVLALLVAVALMIPWKRSQRAIGSAITVGLAVVALAGLGTAGFGLGTVIDPFGRASALASDVATMISPQATIRLGRMHIQSATGVPRGIVEAFNGHCVNAEPWDVSAIFAFPQWRWCPIGAMQSYVAYTTDLDHLDAAAYAHASGGTDRVLRRVDSVDGRNPTWESPAAMLSLLCHFEEIGRGRRWQALARVPDRCGKPQLLGTFRSGGTGALPIQAAPRGSVLVAEVHGLGIDTGERVETLFGRATRRDLIVNGAVTYRVVPDTAPDGLILDVPTDADYGAPFNFDLRVHSLQAEIDKHTVAFSVTLLAVPIKRA